MIRGFVKISKRTKKQPEIKFIPGVSWGHFDLIKHLFVGEREESLFKLIRDIGPAQTYCRANQLLAGFTASERS